MIKTPEQKILELEQKVKLLERQKRSLEQQVEFQQEKAVIFDMMIEIAEKDLGVNIRKKVSPEQLTVIAKSEANQ
jgi:hypothetical protein